MATDDKYDRQLRLWGTHGQRSLMTTSLLLINANAAGTETLKNLVLPGIGRFTILDNEVVSEKDLGTNFFVEKSQLGQPRAVATKDLLCELNPDVQGFARVGDVVALLEAEPDFFASFNIVVGAGLTENVLLPLASLCWERNIPFLSVRAYGLLASCRVQLRYHEIVETKLPSSYPEPRIMKPFPELQAFSKGIDLSLLDSEIHSHVPYYVLQLQAMDRLISRNVESNESEKKIGKDELKSMLRSMARNIDMEENFNEAINAAHKACSERRIDSGLFETAAEAGPMGKNGLLSDFQILLKALQLFVEEVGSAPVSGTLPDMVCTTDLFVELQQIYSSKAASDRSLLKEKISQVLAEERDALSHSMDAPVTLALRDPEYSISDEYIEIFCKNVYDLQIIMSRSLQQEREEPNTDEVRSAALYDTYDDPSQTPIFWYLALRAADRFQTIKGRFPGVRISTLTTESTLETFLQQDTDELWGIMQELVSEFGSSMDTGNGNDDGSSPSGEPSEYSPSSSSTMGLTRSHAAELTRSGASELHNLAALIGGIAAQETVKIITSQYLPMNNTFVYNGIAGCAGTYEL